MMKKLLSIALMVLSLTALSPDAKADALGDALNRLRGQGQIVGTQLRGSGSNTVYEVRLKRPDDRIEVLYIDPRTGRSVGPPSLGAPSFGSTPNYRDNRPQPGNRGFNTNRPNGNFRR